METKCIMTVRLGGEDVDIDLSPLKSIIEHDGLESLSKILRDLQLNYSCVLISNENNDGTYYLGNDVETHLFYLKELADAFDNVGMINLIGTKFRAF